MCGICCFIWVGKEGNEAQSSYCAPKSRLQNRGPDSILKCELDLPGRIHLELNGYVLHFRGQLTPQPLQDSQGNLLLWNGEVFGGLEVLSEENDSQIILQHLEKCANDEEVLHLFSKVKGPWSFIYLQKNSNTLWFGRDYFGRRSLLWHLPRSDDEQDCFGLSSVQVKPMTWEEVPANGIYKMPLLNVARTVIWFPWITATSLDLHSSRSGSNSEEMYSELLNPSESLFCCKRGNLSLKSNICPFNKTLPDSEVSLLLCDHDIEDSKTKCQLEMSPTETAAASQKSSRASNETCNTSAAEANIHSNPKAANEMRIKSDITSLRTILHEVDTDLQQLADKLIEVLSEAVRLRVQNQPKWCDACFMKRHRGTSISEGYSSSEQFGAIYTLPVRDHGGSEASEHVGESASGVNQIRKDKEHSSSEIRHLEQINPDIGERDIRNSGLLLRDNQVEKSIQADSVIPNCNTCNKQFDEGTATDKVEHVNRETKCQHAHVAVLFSGGIDSMVIAALADRHLPEGEPIDLLNVAFEQQVKTTNSNSKKGSKNIQIGQEKDPFKVPDRITGLEGVKELNPNRQWNFIEVNVKLEELQKARNEHVSDLVYPCHTVLDDSIGCAVWFAARGRGICRLSDSEIVEYTSPARVVLVGMGADEQLAGYSRHRVKYNTKGWQGLVDEIDMEIKRISSRNLGRDDRIITDHARESRLPFLDEDVVSFLNTVPIWKKCNLSLPRGLGEKLLLRVAATKLGLGTTALLPKRAIQFGSRIAKMESRNEKASDVCGRLS